MTARGHITLADVAARVDLSKSAVSRILRDVPNSAAPETVVRVRAAAEDLGYLPNALAAGLTHRRTRSVGVVLPDIGNPFFGAVVGSLERCLQRRGFSTVLVNTDNDPVAEQRQIRALVERRVDALVVAPAGSEPLQLQRVQRSGVAVVLIDAHPTVDTFDCVAADDRAGAAMLFDHVWELGHRRIAALAGPRGSTSSAARLAGLTDAAKQCGARLAGVFDGAFTTAGGSASTREALGMTPRPTALLSMNNRMTVGALMALKDASISVPDEMSVAGFDDMDWFDLVRPSITAVAQPAEEIGREAAEALLRRLTEDSAGDRRQASVSLAVVLRPRGSTGPPPVS